LRQYAPSRKVAGSVPDEIIGPNLSSSITALGSTQPLREMSFRDLPGGKGRPACKADLTAICELIVEKNVGGSKSHNHMDLHGLLQGQLYPYISTGRNKIRLFSV
jgi:hypothetical protein